MTEKLYYISSYIKEFDAIVTECRKTDKGAEIILDKTAFYPEGGGQPCDLGTINGIKVLDVQEKEGEVVHYTAEPIEKNTAVHGIIDWDRRFDLMVQHSGEHLVSGFINRRFGYNNVGFHIGSEMITVDLDGEITKEELRETEIQTNKYILEKDYLTEKEIQPTELKNIDKKNLGIMTFFNVNNYGAVLQAFALQKIL